MAITTGVSTQADAQARLQLWLDADEAVSKGQSYAIGDRSLSRAQTDEIRANITFWQRQVQAFRAAGLGAGSPHLRVVRWTG
jgi:hypothetical protein